MNKVVFKTAATSPNILIDFPSRWRKIKNTPWYIDDEGPNNLIKQYSNLFLKKGYKLNAYRIQKFNNINVFIYAMPVESTPRNIEYKVEDGDIIKPIKPQHALNKLMEAIDGDRSPLSYLQAAIFSHEVAEYGASCHSINWRQDVILPVYYAEEPNYEWNIYEEEPEIINPHFYYDKGKNPTIIFYTINDIGIISFNEYKHIFSKKNYTLNVERKVLGTAGAGILL